MVSGADDDSCTEITFEDAKGETEAFHIYDNEIRESVVIDLVHD